MQPSRQLHNLSLVEPTDDLEHLVGSYSFPSDANIDAYHCELSISLLEPGDMVFTLSDGFLPIFEIRSKWVSSENGGNRLKFLPGSIGNLEAITVSRDQIFQLTHPLAESLIGSPCVFVRAEHLIPQPDVICFPVRSLEYFQIRLEHPGTIFVNGVPCLVPGQPSQDISPLPPHETTVGNQVYGRLVLQEWEVEMLLAHGRFQCGARQLE
ncbi:Hint domain-containing protein [Pseudodonghicola sp.]|uniref:Hint domain-containing protein n=1 Tax=Pseudodonghicola sp. TaxID=1969463 RepID=UPI003A96DF94